MFIAAVFVAFLFHGQARADVTFTAVGLPAVPDLLALWRVPPIEHYDNDLLFIPKGMDANAWH